MTALQQSGIYSIANSVNGKCYIGSAANLGRRMRYHRGVKNHTPERAA